MISFFKFFWILKRGKNGETRKNAKKSRYIKAFKRNSNFIFRLQKSVLWLIRNDTCDLWVDHPPPNQDIWLLAQERSKTTFRLKVAENFSNQKSTENPLLALFLISEMNFMQIGLNLEFWEQKMFFTSILTTLELKIG